MHVAAVRDDGDAIRCLRQLGADLNARTKDGKTPLYIAAANNQLKALKVLKELGADLQAVAKDGFTALHIAANNGHVEIIKYLKELGLDCNVRTQIGYTPLHMAAYYGHIEAVKVLIAGTQFSSHALTLSRELLSKGRYPTQHRFMWQHMQIKVKTDTKLLNV